MLRVGLHENIFILFLLAIKTAGSAQKLRVGRVSGNTAIFCLPYVKISYMHSTLYSICFSSLCQQSRRVLTK